MLPSEDSRSHVNFDDRNPCVLAQYEDPSKTANRSWKRQQGKCLRRFFKKKCMVGKKHIMAIILPSNFKTWLLQENLSLLQANNNGADQTASYRSLNSAFVCWNYYSGKILYYSYCSWAGWIDLVANPVFMCTCQLCMLSVIFRGWFLKNSFHVYLWISNSPKPYQNFGLIWVQTVC